MIPHTLTETTLTVLGPDFTPKTIPSTHPAWDEIVEALNAGDQSKLNMLIDLPSAVVSFMQGSVTVTDGVLYFGNRQLDNALARRILHFMDQSQPELAKPLIAFLEKVMKNPSHRAVQGLFEWCERSNLPITSDGYIIAWKIVRSDYTDVHTGTFDNSIGKVVEVERWEVDEDPDRTCSYGLHFCSTEYLPSFGGFSSDRHVMVVRVDPADVVAFPRDYNTSKGRCCRYEVIGEVPAEKAKNFFPELVYDWVERDEFADNPLDDEIELGRRYRTRTGRIAEITGIDYGEDEYFPYEGTIDGSHHCWMPYGNWQDEGVEHGLDLVELLPEDYVPDPKPAPEPKKGWLSRLFGQ